MRTAVAYTMRSKTRNNSVWCWLKEDRPSGLEIFFFFSLTSSPHWHSSLSHLLPPFGLDHLIFGFCFWFIFFEGVKADRMNEDWRYAPADDLKTLPVFLCPPFWTLQHTLNIYRRRVCVYVYIRKLDIKVDVGVVGRQLFQLAALVGRLQNNRTAVFMRRWLWWFFFFFLFVGRHHAAAPLSIGIPYTALWPSSYLFSFVFVSFVAPVWIQMLPSGLTRRTGTSAVHNRCLFCWFAANSITLSSAFHPFSFPTYSLDN